MTDLHTRLYKRGGDECDTCPTCGHAVRTTTPIDATTTYALSCEACPWSVGIERPDRPRAMTDGGTDLYAGAGDGQCLAVKANDGERCTNGVYGSNEFCGHHKRASDVTTAIDASDAEWVKCEECGWQKAEWVPGEPPFCSWCSVEVGPDYEVREGGEC